MASNKLMEAAADILSGSKKNAPAMPTQKLDGEVQDLGGPTPQNYKPDDDSAKLKSPSTDNSARNQASIKAKLSAAAANTKNLMKQEELDFADYTLEELEDFFMSEEYESLDEVSKSTLQSYLNKTSKGPESWRAHQRKATTAGGQAATIMVKRASENPTKKEAGLRDKEEQSWRKTSNRAAGENRAQARLRNESEEFESLFADDSSISEDFKSKASTIFEARVFDRISQIQESMEAEYADMLEESVEIIKEDLTTKVDDYLNYVVEQWIEQNEIAIESGLRSELTEEFIVGLRNLFAEHYIDVPTEKVNLVDELAGKVEELESKLDEEIERGVELKKALVESRKVEITHVVCEGLTSTQVEKIKTLAESIDFSTEDEYQSKLETIRENYFPSGIKKAVENQLHEQVEEANDKPVINDPFVAAVSQAISKTKL